MARPSLATVDYFPHIVKSGKTIFILESKFKNDGYATWFKILELLGSSNGHFIDCRDDSTWQFLIARSLVDEPTLISIIETLVMVGAIDKELWGQKIIFSQNFLDNIRDAYKRRKIPIPTKEFIYATLSLIQPDKCIHIGSQNNQSANINPQSKVNKTKVNKTIIYTPDFETFWREYPRPKQKEKTFELWNYFLNLGVLAENLIDAAKNYARECLKLKIEERFIKYSTTFLSKKDKPFIDYLGGEDGNNQTSPRSSISGEAKRYNSRPL